MFANQSTGVLGIGAYAVLIYQSLGMTGSMPIIMNAVYTTVGVFIAEVTSGLIMDRAGRRRLLCEFTFITVNCVYGANCNQKCSASPSQA